MVQPAIEFESIDVFKDLERLFKEHGFDSEDSTPLIDDLVIYVGDLIYPIEDVLFH